MNCYGLIGVRLVDPTGKRKTITFPEWATVEQFDTGSNCGFRITMDTTEIIVYGHPEKPEGFPSSFKYYNPGDIVIILQACGVDQSHKIGCVSSLLLKKTPTVLGIPIWNGEGS